MEHRMLADMVGQDEDEAAVERRAVFIRQSPMCLDQRAIAAVRIGQTTLSHERAHAGPPSKPLMRREALSIMEGVAWRQRAARCWSGRTRYVLPGLASNRCAKRPRSSMRS